MRPFCSRAIMWAHYTTGELHEQGGARPHAYPVCHGVAHTGIPWIVAPALAGAQKPKGPGNGGGVWHIGVRIPAAYQVPDRVCNGRLVKVFTPILTFPHQGGRDFDRNTYPRQVSSTGCRSPAGMATLTSQASAPPTWKLGTREGPAAQNGPCPVATAASIPVKRTETRITKAWAQLPAGGKFRRVEDEGWRGLSVTFARQKGTLGGSGHHQILPWASCASVS